MAAILVPTKEPVEEWLKHAAPAAIRKWLRSDDGARWAYRRASEAGGYEQVAVDTGLHFNTVRRHARRGEALENENAPARQSGGSTIGPGDQTQQVGVDADSSTSGALGATADSL